LTILVHKQNLQEWAEAKIKETRKRIDELQDKREGIVQEVDRLNNLEPGSIRDKLLRDRTRNVAGIESELRSANIDLYLYRVGSWYSHRFLPTDPFRTLAW